MSNNNPLTNQSYINKDFQTIYPELLDLVKKLTYKWDPTISNESDPGVLLIKLNAIIADKNNYNIDKNILECFPDTVSQYENAYKLYNQLGYNMHWYWSAKGEVSFQWKSDPLLSDGYRVKVKIPQFTMVTDEDKELVYTTLEECVLDTDGSSASVNAIQGVIRDYNVGSDTLIGPSALDYRNRLYFPVSNVAENGVFISDSNKTPDGHYQFVWRNPDVDVNTSWKAVDNLYIQAMGVKCYKFGIDQSNNTCYIEFPEDITNLMGEGIFIKYIQSDGASGNISAKRISQFYNDVEIEYHGEKLPISSETSATNYGSINNGKDPETIDSAYINYKRNVGTFDTLVTLRDYLNYIVNEEFEVVSNGVVADRTNDIQCSYKIVSTRDDTTTVETVRTQNVTSTEVTLVSDDGTTTTYTREDSKDEMSAFDLKTYFLEYSKWPKFSATTDVTSQKAQFKKAYDKSFRFQLNDVVSNENPLDTPEHIRDYYKNAKRIEHDFIPKIASLYRPLFFKNKFKLNMTIIPNNSVTQVQADEIEKNVYEAVLKNLSADKISFGEELSYERVYDICNNADNRIKAIALDSIEYVPYAVIYIDEDVDPSAITAKQENGIDTLELKKGLNEVPIATSILTDWTIDNGYYPDNMTLNERLALDVCAKNILAGTTPLYHPDKSFTRTLEQQEILEINDLEKMDTFSEISFSGMSTNKGAFVGIDKFSDTSGTETSSEDDDSKILDNEALMLYAPNLREVVTYSSSIKYIYYTLSTYTGPDEECIPPNIDYVLDRGQVLFVFWKTEDSKDAPYQYAKYEQGTILKSTARISKSEDEKYGEICASLQSSGYEGEGQILGTLNDLLYNVSDTLLSTTKNIVIKELNQLTLDDTHNYCYWITNDVSDNDGEKSYNLTFDYVPVTQEVISKSYQGGLLYVSNFEWTQKTLNDTKTLSKDEKIYLLRPNSHTVSYTAKNEHTTETYVETIQVTDYVVEEILEEGTTIKCTGRIYSGKNEGIYDLVSTKEKGDTILWGELRTASPVLISAKEFDLENFTKNVDLNAEGPCEYKVYCISVEDNVGSQTHSSTWRCVGESGTLYHNNEYTQNKEFKLKLIKNTETGNYYEMSVGGVPLWKMSVVDNYTPHKYDFIHLQTDYDGNVKSTYYHKGNVSNPSVPSTDVVVGTLNNSTQYVLQSGYRIVVLDESGTNTMSNKETLFEYVLKSGEYFFYTDKDKKGFEMLSDGTKLTLRVPKVLTDEEKSKPIVYSVDAIDLSKINEDQMAAFDTNSWYDFKVNDKEKDATITITENQILMLGEGTYIRVALDSISVPYWTSNDGWGTELVYDNNFDSLKITSDGVSVAPRNATDSQWHSSKGVLGNYTIQYRAESSDSWSELPKATHSSLSWDGYMILNLSSGPKKPQKLDYRHNQSITVYCKDRTSDEDKTILSSTSKNATYLQTSSDVNIAGGKKVDITGVNIEDEVVYMDLIKYYTEPIVGIHKYYEEEVAEITDDNGTFVVDIFDYPNTQTSGKSHNPWCPIVIHCDITASDDKSDGTSSGTLLPIEFVNDYEGMVKFTITSYTDTSGGTVITDNYFLHYGDSIVSGVEFDKDETVVKAGKIQAGVYYYKVSQTTKRLLIQCIRTNEEPISFRMKPLFPFNYIDSIIDDDKRIPQKLIEDRVAQLNVGNKFDYTYEPLEDVVLYDPLNAKSYFNTSHFCNKFTIPQVSDIKIKTVNKRT